MLTDPVAKWGACAQLDHREDTGEQNTGRHAVPDNGLSSRTPAPHDAEHENRDGAADEHRLIQSRGVARDDAIVHVQTNRPSAAAANP